MQVSAQCTMLITWLLCFAVGLEQSPKASKFVSENTSRGQFTFTDGVLEVKGGHGWLRTPRLYLKFPVGTRVPCRHG